MLSPICYRVTPQVAERFTGRSSGSIRISGVGGPKGKLAETGQTAAAQILQRS
jgi:hypothetical protein